MMKSLSKAKGGPDYHAAASDSPKSSPRSPALRLTDKHVGPSMKPSTGVLSPFTASRLNTLQVIRSWDVNKDGTIDPSELRRIAKTYISKEAQTRRHRRIAICAVISVFLSLLAVLAMTILANELSKDTKQRNDGILTTREDGHATTIKTGQARFTYGLDSLPLVPRAALSKLKEISFEVPDGPWIHMRVSTFRHFPNKLLVSSTAQERLQLHFADSLVNYLNPPLGMNISFYGSFDLSTRRRRLQAVTGPLPGSDAIFSDGPPPAETAVATFNDDMTEEVLAGVAVEALVDGPLAVSMVRTKDAADETVYRVAIFNLGATPVDVSAFGVGFRLPHDYLEVSAHEFDLSPGTTAGDPYRVALRHGGPMLAPSPHDGTTPSYSGSINVRPGTQEDITWVSTNFPHGSHGLTRIFPSLEGEGRVFSSTPIDVKVTFSSPVLDVDLTRVQLYGVPLTSAGIQLLDFDPSLGEGTTQGDQHATLRLHVVPGACGKRVTLMLAYGAAVDAVGVRSEAASVSFVYDEDPLRETLLRTLEGLSARPLGSGLPDTHGWEFCAPHCDWEGITCDASDSRAVTALELFSRGMGGSIPQTIGQIGPALRVLDLSDNVLTGTLPGASLGALSGLVELVLNGNKLQGELPVEPLLDIPSLEHLNLGENRLGGTLPKSLGRVATLVELRLQGNRFVGGVPAELGLLDKLVTLDLSLNDLGGTVPSSIVMDSLESMNVMFNHDICGDVPPALDGKIILFQTGLGHPCPGTGLMEPPLASAPGLQTRVPAPSSDDHDDAFTQRVTPTGAVGPRHFVQVLDQPLTGKLSAAAAGDDDISAVFMVYHKGDLTPAAAAPVRLSGLHPAGSVCATAAKGSGRVLYDHVAGRFVIMELASGTGFTSVEDGPDTSSPTDATSSSGSGSSSSDTETVSHALCFLVSSSDDPIAATWVPFSFPTAMGPAHDPRLGLWVDAGFRQGEVGYVGGSNSAYLVSSVETVAEASGAGGGSSSGTASDGTSTGAGTSGRERGGEAGLVMYVLERNQMLNVTDLIANGLLGPSMNLDGDGDVDSINDFDPGAGIRHPRWQHFSLSPDAEAGFPRAYLRLSPVTLAPGGPEAPANKCPLFMRHVPYRLSRGGADGSSGTGGELEILRVCVNFAYPPASRVTRSSVALADFYPTICGSGAGVACIPQADSSARLDPGKETLLANPVYRRVPLPAVIPTSSGTNLEAFADIITGVFTVDANRRDPFSSGGEEQAGLHWFRLKAASPSWVFALEQEGTWALADKDHAFAGAAVTDARGNLALAYFASGVLKHPQLRYAGLGRPGNASSTSSTSGDASTMGSSTANGGSEAVATGTASGAELAAFYEGLTGPLPGGPLAAPSLVVDPVDGCTIYVTGARFVAGGEGVGGQAAPVGTGLSMIRFGDCQSG
eukprot:jgi/Mesvir1/22938/Mv19450-RA.2